MDREIYRICGVRETCLQFPAILPV